MIDQTTLGHRFLRDEFGVQPRTTWQMCVANGWAKAKQTPILTLRPSPFNSDPFGHSSFSSSFLSSPTAGFNAVYFARADFEDFAKRSAEKSTEFFWAPSPSRGTSQATLGGIVRAS